MSAWTRRAALGALLLGLGAGQARAECTWPADLPAFEHGQVLTHADLNRRFDAVSGCMRTIPANVGDIANLDAIIQARVQAEVAAAVANLEFSADSVADPTACGGAGGTTVTFRHGDRALDAVLVCNGDAAIIQRDLQLRVDLGIEAGAGPDACGPGLDGDGCFRTVTEALSWLAPRRIASNAQVTIRVSPGRWTDHATIVLDHLDGARIRLVGPPRVAEGAAATLEFVGRPGVVVKPGTHVGQIANLSLTFEGVPTASDVGLLADSGAVAQVEGLTITGFFDGLRAQNGAVVVRPPSTPDLGFVDQTSNGAVAEYGATVRLRSASASGGTTGFRAQFGGVFECEACTAESNTDGGFHALLGGVLNARKAISNGNRAGFWSQANSTVFAFEAVDNRSDISLVADNDAYLQAYLAESRQARVGLMSEHGSVVAAERFVATRPAEIGISLSSGYLQCAACEIHDSSGRGIVVALHATLFAKGGAGLQVLNPEHTAVEVDRGSYAELDGLIDRSAVGDGVQARHGAWVDAADATSSNHAGRGWVADEGATIAGGGGADNGAEDAPPVAPSPGRRIP